MLLYVLPDEFDDEVKRINYEYYEKRTMHKSSLSPCIHSIMGIEIGDTTKALQYFFRSALVDLHDNQGNTEYGMHIASAGGTWMAVVFGFGGFRVKNNQMTFKPWLPEEWDELHYKLKWHGDDLKVTIRHHEAEFTLVSDDATKTEEIIVFDKPYQLESGKETTIPFSRGVIMSVTLTRHNEHERRSSPNRTGQQPCWPNVRHFTANKAVGRYGYFQRSCHERGAHPTQ